MRVCVRNLNANARDLANSFSSVGRGELPVASYNTFYDSDALATCLTLESIAERYTQNAQTAFQKHILVLYINATALT